MASSLTNLADDLAEEIHKNKCKDCICVLECERANNNLIKYKCLSSNKSYPNKIDARLQKKFKNTFKFSNNDINKFVLMLRKGVCSYAYMDGKRFNETLLPKNEDFLQ